jgi:hypothetical protein
MILVLIRKPVQSLQATPYNPKRLKSQDSGEWLYTLGTVGTTMPSEGTRAQRLCLEFIQASSITMQIKSPLPLLGALSARLFDASTLRTFHANID